MTRVRHWMPCRVCGERHVNPASSSICVACGVKGRAAREQSERMMEQAWEESPFGRFMSLSEDERWECVFKFLHPEKED